MIPILSTIAGTVLGVGAEWVKKGQELKLLKASQEHEVTMSRIHAENKSKEVEGTVRLETIRSDAAVSVADAGALTAAISAQADAMKGVSKWVKNLNGIMRPVLTFVLSVSAVYFGVTKNESIVAIAVVELAGTACGFWFGSRVFGRK